MKKSHKFWKGAVTSKGYGNLKRLGKWWLAHRWVWTKTYGPIPKGKQVRHLCGIKLCIEPTHLALGTQSDNEKDKIRHGTARYYFQYAKRIGSRVIAEER